MIKTLNSKYGHKVNVAHKVLRTADNLHVFEIRARCGDTLEISRITIGSVDGKRPHPPTKEQLQAQLDRHRTRLADEASWKEKIREVIGELE